MSEPRIFDSFAEALANAPPMSRAALFIAHAAYPEPNKGLPGGEGERFQDALVQQQLRRIGAKIGGKALREAYGAYASDLLPKHRIIHALAKGMRRLDAAEKALFVHSTATLSGQPAGRLMNAKTHLWAQAFSVQKNPLAEHVEHDDERVKALKKKIKRFRPIFHMVAAMHQFAPDARNWIEGEPADGPYTHIDAFAVAGMVAHPERWIDHAIAFAEAWRTRRLNVANTEIAHRSGRLIPPQGDLAPESMVPLA